MSLPHCELHHIAFIRRKPVANAPLSNSCPANPSLSLPHFELHHLHHSHPLHTASSKKPASTALFGDSCLPKTASLPRFELHHLHCWDPLHPAATAPFRDSYLWLVNHTCGQVAGSLSHFQRKQGIEAFCHIPRWRTSFLPRPPTLAATCPTLQQTLPRQAWLLEPPSGTLGPLDVEPVRHTGLRLRHSCPTSSVRLVS